MSSVPIKNQKVGPMGKPAADNCLSLYSETTYFNIKHQTIRDFKRLMNKKLHEKAKIYVIVG